MNKFIQENAFENVLHEMGVIIVQASTSSQSSHSVNSLRAKFFRGNINIHLHFMSLLHIDMTQVLKILPQVRPGPTYSKYM